MAMAIGTEFLLWMTHVDSEGPYLKMFGQADKKEATKIERLIMSSRDDLRAGLGRVQPNALRCGMLCIAKYHDDSFYRATIINLLNIDSGFVSVCFIDYGNSDSIPASSIRLINSYPDALKSSPPQATDYLLSSIINPNGMWDETAVSEIRNLIYYNELSCVVELFIYNKYFVKMQFKGVDLSQYLYSRKYGVEVSLQNQQIILQKMLSGVKILQNPPKNFPAAHAGPPPHKPSRFASDVEAPPENVGQGYRFQIAQNSPHYEPYARNTPKEPVVANKMKLRNMTAPRPLNRGPDERSAARFESQDPPKVAAAGAPPVQKNPSTYKSRLLELNSQHEVHVSFAKDGPKLFAIQLKSDENFLTSIVSRVNSEPPKVLSEPPMIGSVCLGRFSEDNTLCRAVVMGLTPSQCKLFFVDFGMTESVSHSDIFSIPEEFVTPCVFALRFSLSGIMGLQITEEIKNEFYEIVNNKVLTLRVVPPEGPPLIQYCELFCNGESVKDILLQKQNPSFQKIDPASISGEHSVLVSYVDSCTKFYIQLSDNIDALNAMMGEVDQHCAQAAPIQFHQVKCGMTCCALFPDDHNWYRALVTNIRKDRITVNYVDYGNDQEVTAESLRPISQRLMKMKAQAIHCALKMFEDKPFDQRTSDSLEALTLEKILNMRVQGLLEGGVLLVDLMDHSRTPPTLIADAINRALVAPPAVSANPIYSPPQPSANEGTNVSAQATDVSSHKKGKGSYNTAERKNNYDNNSDKSFDSKDGGQPRKTWKKHDRDSEQGYNNYDRKNEKHYGGHREPYKRNDANQREDNPSLSKPHQKSYNWTEKKKSAGGVGTQYHRENTKQDRFYKAKSGQKEYDGERGKQYSDRSQDQGKKYDNSWKNKSPNKYGDTSAASPSLPAKSLTNPVSFETPFQKYTLNNGEVQNVKVSWFVDPNDFFIQIISQEKEFNVMMFKIPNQYSGIKPNSSELATGSSVLARFPEDRVLYRAQVLESNYGNYTVQFVDFGNTSQVTATDIWQLEDDLMEIPRLSVHCSLHGITPAQGTWATDPQIKEYFTSSLYKCTFHSEQDGIYHVSLCTEDGMDIGQKLVENNYALSDSANTNAKPESTTKVFVTHIDTPGQFWLQLESDSDSINSLQATLEKNAESYEDYLDHEVGQLCVSKYSADEQFYRTIILDSDNDIITVRFIDYGNTDVLDNTPGVLKSLPAELQTIEPYAMKCSVNATPTGTGQWTEQSSDMFTQLLGNTENPIDADFILKGATTYVNLYVDDQNTTDKLVGGGHATHADKSDGGDLPTCFASHLNSPSEFWIQLESSILDLEAISEELLNASDFPPLSEIAEETICAAKFPEDDLWYRAQVIIHGNDGTEVLFMDYGNASLTNELRSLPENLKNLPALSRKCALQKPTTVQNWSKEAELKFADLAADGATIFNVSFIASGDISIVELYIDGKSVTEELVSLCELNASTPDRLPLVGEDKMSPVCICYSSCPEDFWVHYVSSQENLDIITETLADAENFDDLKDLEEGALCVSMFPEDSLWYRSKILSHGENGSEVSHIDYGSVSVAESFKQLPKALHDLPPLAKHCSLLLPHEQTRVNEKFHEKFAELALDDSIEYRMEIIDSNVDPMIVKLISNGQDLVNMLNSSDEFATKIECKNDLDNLESSDNINYESYSVGDEIQIKQIEEYCTDLRESPDNEMIQQDQFQENSSISNEQLDTNDPGINEIVEQNKSEEDSPIKKLETEVSSNIKTLEQNQFEGNDYIFSNEQLETEALSIGEQNQPVGNSFPVSDEQLDTIAPDNSETVQLNQSEENISIACNEQLDIKASGINEIVEQNQSKSDSDSGKQLDTEGSRISEIVEQNQSEANFDSGKQLDTEGSSVSEIVEQNQSEANFDSGKQLDTEGSGISEIVEQNRSEANFDSGKKLDPEGSNISEIVEQNQSEESDSTVGNEKLDIKDPSANKTIEPEETNIIDTNIESNSVDVDKSVDEVKENSQISSDETLTVNNVSVKSDKQIGTFSTSDIAADLCMEAEPPTIESKPPSDDAENSEEEKGQSGVEDFVDAEDDTMNLETIDESQFVSAEARDVEDEKEIKEKSILKDNTELSQDSEESSEICKPEEPKGNSESNEVSKAAEECTEKSAPVKTSESSNASKDSKATKITGKSNTATSKATKAKKSSKASK